MLYLEDYLEMIEHLPIELRDRFTEMREIDLGVENTVDSLEARQKEFFGRAAGQSVSEREEEYNKIRKDYLKVVEESMEKIQIAEESYGLVDRYLRKLDQELHKFQLELEADNRGITEVLEKRSLELDAPTSRPSSYMKENRLPKKLKTPSQHTTIAHTPRYTVIQVMDNGWMVVRQWIINISKDPRRCIDSAWPPSGAERSQVGRPAGGGGTPGGAASGAAGQVSIFSLLHSPSFSGLQSRPDRCQQLCDRPGGEPGHRGHTAGPRPPQLQPEGELRGD
jgi:hypothetical protein